MRLRQWVVSIIFFAVSVGFLLFSKAFFSPRGNEHIDALSELPATECRVRLLPNQDYYPVLKSYFQKAQTTISGTVYLVKTADYPNNEPADLLRELAAASKRNVHVDLVLEQGDSKDGTESNESAAQILQNAGVNVRFDPSDIATHAKTFVVDGRYTFIGSHNLTHAAMSRNEELSVFIDSPEIAQKVTKFIQEIPSQK